MKSVLNPSLVKSLSLVATSILVVAVLWLLFSKSLFSTSPFPLSLQIAAGVLMLWARLTFGFRSFHAAANPTEGGLITSGPYRFIRNPIYSAIWLFTWAGIAAHLSTLNILLGLVIAIGLAVRILCEEFFLFTQFPTYAEYARRTPRVIPFIF